MNPVELARPEIRALAPYASARSLAGSSGVLLNANENPWAPDADARLELNRYPDPQPAELRARLARLYGVDEQQLLITRGSDEGIDLLVRAFCRPGHDRVLTCPPCFGMYAIAARIQGAGLVEVPLLEVENHFVPDMEAIAEATAAAGPCRVNFLCSPNNPTGDGIEREQVLALADRLAETGLVVIDEAYVEFARRPSLAAEVARHRNLVVLRTLSKAFALAGCRIGVVIADSSVIELLRRIIAPYPLPAPSVAAALAVLSPEALARQAGQRELIEREKARLVSVLKNHPEVVKVWPGEANFVLARLEDGPGLVRAAATAGILLRDQSAQPGLDNCVRITIGTPEENARLVEFLDRYRSGSVASLRAEKSTQS